MKKAVKNTTRKSKTRTLAKAAPLCVLCAALVGTSAVAGGMSTPLPQTQSSQKAPELSQGKMLIQEAGTYTLTGNMRGTVYVDPGVGDVTLILDNVNISGGENGAIAAVSGDSLTIQPKEGTVNNISDNGQTTELGTPVYSKVNLTFQGNGSLNITGGMGQGIRTHNADIAFEGGEYFITSEGNGLSAEGDNPGRILLNNGSVYISSRTNAVNPNSALIKNGGELHDLSSETYQGTFPVWQSPEKPAFSFEQASLPEMPGFSGEQMTPPESPSGSDSQMPDMTGQMPGMNGTVSGSTDKAGEVVTSDAVNTAAELKADYDNASTITVTEEDSQVNISESGTYVVTGSSSNGNITVKKGTTGVVLVLEDLDLTSLTGATLSVNKNAEVQIVVSGDVTLTDAENPADEESTDAEVADAFDGAAIKVKAESVVVITGDGTLNLNGNAKNGIKAGDDSSLVIDGDLTLNIAAANDGINSNYDVTILDGDVTINAADDGIHADHILTIGSEDGTGPDLTVESSTEGLEGTVVNIMSGKIDVTSTDDAVNAANGDGVYEGVLDYSFNMTGGDLTINAQGDGIDSNGNVNLIDGTASIKSSTQAGEAGIDYDGEMYISDDFNLNNQTGISGQDMMPGMNQSGMNQGAMNQGGPAFGRR